MNDKDFFEGLAAIGAVEEESSLPGVRVFTLNPNGGTTLSKKPETNDTEQNNEIIFRVRGAFADALNLIISETPREIQRRVEGGFYATQPEKHEQAREYLDGGGTEQQLADLVEDALWDILTNVGKSNVQAQAKNDKFIDLGFVEKLNELGTKIYATELSRRDSGNTHASYVTIEIANEAARETR